MKSKTTFTKRDLVVVLCGTIFLLANLGAIGGSGRRRAKEAVCLSNLRQWGAVFSMYLGDNEGIFMQGWVPATSSPEPHKHYWMEALRPYYGNNHKLRCCPEATITGTEIGQGPYGGVQPDATFYAWGVFPGDVCGEPSIWSYAIACDYGSLGWNGYLGNPPEGFGIWGKYKAKGIDPNWRTANVTGADNIPLFLDHQFVDCWPDYTDEPPEYDGQPWNWSSQMGRVCLNRHNGFVNSAFLDFSARKVGLKELWRLKWHREYDICGPWTKCGGILPEDWPEWMQEFHDY